VPYRPLAFVAGLALGDYLLWNWSLNSGHDVLALVSGLTLPPLAVACVWLLALTLARLLAHTARLPAGRLARGRTRGRTSGHREPVQQPETAAARLQDAPASAASTGAPSRKIAA
jgi:hypothetical protein